MKSTSKFLLGGIFVLLLTLLLLTPLFLMVSPDKWLSLVGQNSFISKVSLVAKPVADKTPDITKIPTQNDQDIQKNVPIISGQVSGKLCFPSEGIPPLMVYLKNVALDDYMSINTPQNQATYKFDNVPVGSYIAFAYLKSDDYGGSYSAAVLCGLSVGCTDHKPKVFEVEPGKTTMGIDICDWYGKPSDMPAKPM